MLSVSLFVELLRTRPRALFWAMVLAQVTLWTLVPTLFYAAPPGQLPEVLAIGREFQLGSDFGPPLASWLATITYAGAGLFGVYLLSQVCIVVTYWVVLNLGRAIVGESQAVLAVLLMAGIAVFTVPTPDFGPAILATPLWALMLMHFWQALGQGRQGAWFILALEAGLLVLTTYVGLILVGLILLFTLLSARGRAQLTTIHPWLAGIVAVVVVFPHLMWLDQERGVSIVNAATIEQNLGAWLRLVAALLIGHAGIAVLAVLGRGIGRARQRPAPEIYRAPIDPLARFFVYFFAFVPMIAISLYALFTRRPESFVAAPLVVLSGLALVVAAGDRIRIVHQRVAGFAWGALIVLPPLLVATVVTIVPWTVAVDLQIAQPAAEMGRFFGESFRRRTGRPLAIVAGEPRTAALVALMAPSRPSLYLDATPELSSWVTARDIEEKGIVVVWPTTDTGGTPPAAIRQHFPNLVPEVPRSFERRFQGRMSLVRIGWGMIRPRGPAAPQ